VTFIDLGGASIGFQAGVESADVVLVFKTRNSLDRILGGRGKLTLGADAAIAAGPVGRQAEAGTDARLRAEIVSYSRSRGLFAGVALDGAVLVYDRRTNAEYLGAQRPEVVQLTVNLLSTLARMSAPVAPPGAVISQAPAIVPRTTAPAIVPRTTQEPPLAPAPLSPPASSAIPQRMPRGN
jgi:hypothetical protein